MFSTRLLKRRVSSNSNTRKLESSSSLEKQRNFFEQIGQRLGIKLPSDWYNVKFNMLDKYGGRNFLQQHFGGSLASALCNVYPEYVWEAWRFAKVPVNFWSKLEHQRQFLSSAAISLHIRSRLDWARVSTCQLQELGGTSLLRYHGNSIDRAIEKLFDPEEIPIDRLAVLPIENHDRSLHSDTFRDNGVRLELEAAGRILGVTCPEDWVSIRMEVLGDRTRQVLQSVHGGSLHAALVASYPNRHWPIWCCLRKLPRSFWNDLRNVQAFGMWASERLQLPMTPDQWSSLEVRRLRSLSGASGMLRAVGGLYGLLVQLFPSQRWSFRAGRARSISKAQTWLLGLLGEFFPGQAIYSDCPLSTFRVVDMSQAFDKHTSTLRLDILLPGVDLAFEYQGEQHFQWHFRSGSALFTQQRDAQKRKICASLGLTLIEVPYHWNISIKENIFITIRNSRPDLLFSSPLNEMTLSQSIRCDENDNYKIKAQTCTMSMVPIVSKWN